jgi:hypothetical protein
MIVNSTIEGALLRKLPKQATLLQRAFGHQIRPSVFVGPSPDTNERRPIVGVSSDRFDIHRLYLSPLAAVVR